MLHGIPRVGKFFIEDAEDREDGLFAVLQNRVLSRTPEGTVEGLAEIATFPTLAEARALAERETPFVGKKA